MPSEISSMLERIRDRSAEHLKRMEQDPEYRAREEKRELEIAERQVRYETENAARNKRSARVKADMPPRVWPLLDAPDETEALANVREFMAGKATFLVLSGGVGCGKTVAACSALDAEGGRFVKAAGVTRARFNDEAWTTILETRVLVVDDLGTESLDEKGWAAGALAELFDHRYDWQAKTILTTNLDAEAFKARYCSQDGGRFLSRLREAGKFISIGQGSLRAVAT